MTYERARSIGITDSSSISNHIYLHRHVYGVCVRVRPQSDGDRTPYIICVCLCM